MRYLSAILAGLITYPIAFAIMAELLNVRQDSWYWLPFAASGVAVVMVARPWHASVGGELRRAVALTAASVMAVLVIDLNGGVWYSRFMTLFSQDSSSPRTPHASSQLQAYPQGAIRFNIVRQFPGGID